MPASTPLATGSEAVASVRSDPPKAASISTTMASPPKRASRSTSALICVREATAKVGVPERVTVNALARLPASASKPVRTCCRARCCASRSEPSARVMATSTARAAVRDTHTPASLRGACVGSIDSAMRTVSPVGSRQINGLMLTPAGVPSSAVVSSMAARKPATVKRSASTAGLST